MGVRSIQQVVTELAADFTKHGVAASVVFGNWQPEQHAGADRVVVGLGGFNPMAQGLSPGLTPGYVVNGASAAATLSVMTQEGVVWVHGVAPGDTAIESVTAASHARTSDLLHATIAGLIRVVGYGSLSFGAGEWPAVDTGDVTYGALCRFRFAVAVPVLGTPLVALAAPTETETTMVLNAASGEQDGPVIETEGPP